MTVATLTTLLAQYHVQRFSINSTRELDASQVPLQTKSNASVPEFITLTLR